MSVLLETSLGDITIDLYTKRAVCSLASHASRSCILIVDRMMGAYASSHRTFSLHLILAQGMPQLPQAMQSQIVCLLLLVSHACTASSDHVSILTCYLINCKQLQLYAVSFPTKKLYCSVRSGCVWKCWCWRVCMGVRRAMRRQRTEVVLICYYL